MEYETKTTQRGGSITTTIPSALVKILEIEKGDKLNWDIQIKNDNIIIELINKSKKNDIN